MKQAPCAAQLRPATPLQDFVHQGDKSHERSISPARLVPPTEPMGAVDAERGAERSTDIAVKIAVILRLLDERRPGTSCARRGGRIFVGFGFASSR